MRVLIFISLIIFLSQGNYFKDKIEHYMTPVVERYAEMKEVAKEIREHAASQPKVKQSDCPDWANQVTSLPYWDSSEEMPCMYAGTINPDITGQEDKHLFYWFFPNPDVTKPVALWLNGGPGAASMFGLFLENGPIRIERTGTTEDDYIIRNVPEGSWVDVAHMIFVDQPIGTGFSYGDPLHTKMQDGADDIRDFLVQFFKTYDELADNDFYLTGESYSGKYLPIMAQTIMDYNDAGPSSPINLAGVMIGDPFNSPAQQRLRIPLEPKSLNIIADSNMAQIDTLQRLCEEAEGTDSIDPCNNIMGYVEAVSAYVMEYDSRLFGYEWDPIESIISDFFNNAEQKDEFYAAINLGATTNDPAYSDGSAVSDAYVPEEMDDYTLIYNDILERGMPVFIYAGEFDMKDGPRTQYVWLEAIDYVKGTDLFTQFRKIYYFTDWMGNEYTGGYWQQSGLITYLTVPKAGHFVPNTYLSVTKTFFQDFITNKGLTCHSKLLDKCEISSSQCTYMDECSDNGVCTNGFCACNAGFTGADCSAALVQFTSDDSQTISGTGNYWTYFSFADDLGALETFSLTLSVDVEGILDVYLSTDASVQPTLFDSDAVWLNQQQVIIDSKNLPDLGQFQVLARVHGVDYFNNANIDSVLTYTFARSSNQNSRLQSHLKQMAFNRQETTKQDWLLLAAAGVFFAVVVSVMVMVALYLRFCYKGDASKTKKVLFHPSEAPLVLQQ